MALMHCAEWSIFWPNKLLKLSPQITVSGSFFNQKLFTSKQITI